MMPSHVVRKVFAFPMLVVAAELVSSVPFPRRWKSRMVPMMVSAHLLVTVLMEHPAAKLMQILSTAVMRDSAFQMLAAVAESWNKSRLRSKTTHGLEPAQAVARAIMWEQKMVQTAAK